MFIQHHKQNEIISLIKYTQDGLFHELVIELCKQALTLFNEDDVIDILKYLSISAYYVNKMQIGCFISDFILCKSSKFNKIALRNLSFYSKSLLIKAEKRFEFKVDNIPVELTNKFYISCNPSIIEYNDGYLLSIRLVNYSQDRASRYTIFSNDKKVRSRNFIVRLNSKLEKISSHEILDCSNRKRYPSSVIGIEDIRLFKDKSSLKFQCTIPDGMNKFCPKIGYGLLPSIDQWNDKIVVEDINQIKSPISESTCEKNWLPICSNLPTMLNDSIIKDDVMRVIYNVFPIRLFDINNKDLSMKEVKDLHKFDLGWKGFRGGSIPIHFDEGLLIIIHEVFYEYSKRSYMSRFIWYNKDLSEIKVSLPFTFEGCYVEMCMGCCNDLDDPNNLIISVGVEDKHAFVYKVLKSTVRLMLENGVTKDTIKTVSEKSISSF